MTPIALTPRSGHDPTATGPATARPWPLGRLGLTGRSAVAALALGAILASPAQARESLDPGLTDGPLRVCADPDNLPFSSSSGPRRGFYIELAEKIGQAMGRSIQTVWYDDHGARGIRRSLGAGLCDIQVGLPAEDFMERRLEMSRSFASLSYVMVFPKDSSARTLEDLKGRRIAVQLGSPPQNVVVLRDDMESVTVRSPEAGIKAVLDGEADAAWLWGPSAGYAIQTGAGDRLRLEPTPEGPGMHWQVAVAMQRGHKVLHQKIDEALGRIGADLSTLAASYGIETAVRPKTSLADAEGRLASSVATVSEAVAVTGAAAGRPVVRVPSSIGFVTVADAAADVEPGRVLFNTHCAHCHGTNAESPDPKIDLRRLGRRYRSDAESTFDQTVHEGRPEKGMPPWKGILPEDEISKVKAYVFSAQSKK